MISICYNLNVDKKNSSENTKAKETYLRILSIKPIYFFLGFVIISTLIAFILGGYFIGKYE